MTTLNEFLKEWHSDSERMLVHTSGSTGTPKPLWVEKRRMTASARTTCRFLGLKPGDTALLCMSLDYIAGMMMAVRAEVCGLQLVEVTPSGHPLAGLESAPTFAAMVPMQVFNSMQVPAERDILKQIKHLIIGGGAIDDDLAAELKGFPHAIWSTYGMTETLSHIALRRLNGPDASEWYTPLDGVSVGLSPDGCLTINAPEVCASTLVTNDIADIDSDGRHFRIHGRKDNVICSGGIKIQAEEVERMLAPHINAPFIITKRKDKKFGEVVVLLLQDENTAEAITACKKVLPKYWQPQAILPVSQIPTTETGKPARKEAEKMAETARCIPA